MGRNKEQSARMIDHMAVHAPRLVAPYVQPVLKILVPKLNEPDLNPSILISILACIGDLAQVIQYLSFKSILHFFLNSASKLLIIDFCF